jgi:ferredoxin
MDKSCVSVCPVDCIHEASRMLVIDPLECIDCGACLPECPVDAIFEDHELPAEWRTFERVNAAWTDGRDAVEATLEAHLLERGSSRHPSGWTSTESGFTATPLPRR